MSENDKNITINSSGMGHITIGDGNKVLGDIIKRMDGITDASADQKIQLQDLITKLQSALEQASAEQANDAQKVAKRVERVVEDLSEEEPDADDINHSLDKLKKAATNIQAVLPVAAQIAFQIVTHASKMMG